MPYFPGVEVEGSHFYGRDHEVASVLECDWAWICGQRRMGKSSLLKQLKKEMGSRGDLPLYCNFQRLPETATGVTLLDTFVRSNRRELQSWGIEASQLPQESPGGFRALVEKLAASGKRVVFLWDEAERLLDVEKNTPGFLGELYGELGNIGELSFYLGATQTLSGLLAKGEGPSEFLKRFRWRPLAGLSSEASERLLRCSNTSDWKSPLPDKLVEDAVDWCGGQPFLLQHLGALLREEIKWEGRKGTAEILEKCRGMLVVDPILRNTLDDDYGKLTPNQQAVLSAICHAPAGHSLQDIATSTGLPEVDVADAAGFLASYGYVTWGDKPRLRFNFYRRLLPQKPGSSQSEQRNIDRMGRTIFISYSRLDDEFRQKLVAALKPFARQLDIQVFDDQQIQAGEAWGARISSALQRASVAVMLVSPDFLASDFITSKELPQILERARSGRCIALSLNVGYFKLPAAMLASENLYNALASLQALNPPTKPLNALPPHEQQKVIVDAAATIIQQVSVI